MKRVYLLLTFTIAGLIVVQLLGERVSSPQSLADVVVPADAHRSESAAAVESKAHVSKQSESPTTTVPQPGYCGPKKDVNGLARASATEFHSRHPELVASLADAELIFDSFIEIGIAAAQLILDVDSDQKVHAGSPFQGKHISELEAPAAGGDPDAALIFGSWLLFQGYGKADLKRQPFDRAPLEQGERYLQYAYRAGKSEAAERLYMHFYLASRRAWRETGDSELWQYAEPKRSAYAEWLLSYGPAGRALMVDNDGRSMRVNSPAGLPMPSDSQNPALLAAQLLEIEQAIPPPQQNPELKLRREQLLWLNRRGTIDAVIAVYAKDCDRRR